MRFNLRDLESILIGIHESLVQKQNTVVFMSYNDWKTARHFASIVFDYVQKGDYLRVAKSRFPLSGNTIPMWAIDGKQPTRLSLLMEDEDE